MSTTDVMDHTETDIRERILITTERLFREVGYQKTTVADIAKTLRMSPANVYRFFDSKRSITLCNRRFIKLPNTTGIKTIFTRLTSISNAGTGILCPT